MRHYCGQNLTTRARYMVFHKFDEISTDLGVAVKEVNTVTDQWPMKLKHQPGETGAQEEFDVLLGSNFSGLEHYVEWKRVEE